MNLDPVLLEILACPDDHAPLEVHEETSELWCTSCDSAYPVQDDIPVLLLHEARRRGVPAPRTVGRGVPGAGRDPGPPAGRGEAPGCARLVNRPTRQDATRS